MEEANKNITEAAAPTVIGLYGLPASGKTTLLHRLQEHLPNEAFHFYEGSDVIASLVEGGLEAFKDFETSEQAIFRQRAIEHIRQQCTLTGRTGLVTGHFMLWSEQSGFAVPVYTAADLATFSHVIYMNTPAEEIASRCISDTLRARQAHPHLAIEEWRRKEESDLRDLCSRNDILYYSLPGSATTEKVAELCLDFARHSQEHNLERAAHALDLSFDRNANSVNSTQTVIVFDGDKTLAPFDTGKMFHDTVSRKLLGIHADFLQSLFGGRLGYSYLAFRQLVLAYDEILTDCMFEEICFETASAVHMHPEMASLLGCASKTPHTKVVVFTSGLKRIWENVLQLAKLDHAVQVIGGGRLCDGYVVNAAVKAQLVSRLRNEYRQYVWVFGDSILDLEMLQEADQAVVVVGDEETRSHTMDDALDQALQTTQLRARQALLPKSVRPRLDFTRLPPCDPASDDFIKELLLPRMDVHDETESSAAKLLMTATRDAEKSGPLLRKAHERVGRYLATHALAKVIGLEEYPIKHVQGGLATGYRLRGEARTLVVALMRGGEPLALGVSDTFPGAAFLHAKNSGDIRHTHLNDCENVILVDSVVNNGTTMKDAIEQVRALRSKVTIVVVACVVQRRSIGNEGLLRAAAIKCGIKLVTLRVSDNQFTGQGTTDTGNRLFNTTFLQ